MSARSGSSDPTQPLLGPAVDDERVTIDADNNGQPCIASDVPGSEKELTTATIVVMAAAVLFSFVAMGLSSSTIGVVLPLIEGAYGLNDIQVSLIFLAVPAGYISAAQLNHQIHLRLGRRGIASVGPIFQFLSTTFIAMSPPFPALVASFALGGFGIGILDGSWCAWAGAMKRANLVSGLLHGSFSLGAGVGPVIASSILSAENTTWYHVYYMLAAVFLLELLLLPWAFRYETPRRYREQERCRNLTTESGKHSAIFKYQATWISALYLLVDVGTETAVSGWIVSFMLRVRHTSPRFASISESGFWIGMAIGRITLGGITDRIGVRAGNSIYLACTVVLQSVFMLVENPWVSTILITLTGFFLGPAFPSCIVQLTRMLPKGLHVGAVSLVASVGQVGGALLPFGIGALSQWLGLEIFGIVVLIQLTACLFIWIFFTWPRMDMTVDAEQNSNDDVREHEV